MTVSALDAAGTVIRKRTFEEVPVTRNRITIFSGKLWGKDSGFTISLNVDWIDPYEGSW